MGWFLSENCEECGCDGMMEGWDVVWTQARVRMRWCQLKWMKKLLVDLCDIQAHSASN